MYRRLRQALEHYNKSHPDAPLTQAELATRIGTTQAHVSRHLNGKIVPSNEYVTKYAEVLEVSRTWLLFGDDDMRGVA